MALQTKCFSLLLQVVVVACLLAMADTVLDTVVEARKTFVSVGTRTRVLKRQHLKNIATANWIFKQQHVYCQVRLSKP